MLDGALQHGLLVADNPGWYRLTRQGKEALSAFFDSAHEAIAAAPVLPAPQMEELAAPLQRNVDTAQKLPLPQAKKTSTGAAGQTPDRRQRPPCASTNT